MIDKANNAIIASPNWATPWRMMIVGDRLATIMESTVTKNLSPPSKLKIESWMKPGVAVFPWWGDRYGANMR